MSTALTIQLNKPVGNEQNCRGLLVNFQKQIVGILPKHIPEAVLLNAIMNSVRKNPKLLDCEASSMLSAVMCCAETGLIPDSPLQECHLIPFKGKVVWIPGYRGLVKLARQSGDMADVESAVVCEGDKFSYRLGLKPNLIHVPKLGDDRGELMYVYAIGRFKDVKVRPRFEVMDKKMVDKIRNSSPGKSLEAWTNHYDEQARKTVLKRLLKTAALSPQLASSIERDNRLETGDDPELHDTVKELVENVAELRKPATDKLTADMKKKAIATGSIPKGEVKVEAPVEEQVPDEEPAPESVLHDEAVAEILKLVEKHGHLLSKSLVGKCSEENLSGMVIEALGVVKEEIAEQVKKAEKLKVKA